MVSEVRTWNGFLKIRMIWHRRVFQLHQPVHPECKTLTNEKLTARRTQARITSRTGIFPDACGGGSEAFQSEIGFNLAGWIVGTHQSLADEYGIRAGLEGAEGVRRGFDAAFGN